MGSLMWMRIGILYDRLILGLAWLAGLMMMFALIIVCIDVFMRYLFNMPMEWVLETCEYLLLYITFLPAAWILREEGHVKVDIVLNRLSPARQAVVTGITSIMGGLTMGGVMIFGAKVTVDYYRRGVPSLGNMRLPEYIILGIIPIGSFFFAIEFFRRAYRSFRSTGALRTSGEYLNI